MNITAPDGRPATVVGHFMKDGALHVRVVPIDPPADDRSVWLVGTTIAGGSDEIIGEGMTAADIDAAIATALRAGGFVVA